MSILRSAVIVCLAVKSSEDEDSSNGGVIRRVGVRGWRFHNARGFGVFDRDRDAGPETSCESDRVVDGGRWGEGEDVAARSRDDEDDGRSPPAIVRDRMRKGIRVAC